jgi:ATP synthase protein I
MVASIQRPGYEIVKRLIATQLAVTLILSLLFVFMSGKAAYSALLGGLVAIIPNCLFACRLFAHTGAQAAKAIISSLYRGEAIKLFITIILLVIIFRFIPITALAFFSTYILALMVFWIFLSK